MADEKPHVGKEFGEVPPRLNIAGELFAGGAVPPSLNLPGEAIKGMVPVALPKIPLAQPAQGQTDTPGGNQSGNTESGGSGSSEKK